MLKLNHNGKKKQTFKIVFYSNIRGQWKNDPLLRSQWKMSTLNCLVSVGEREIHCFSQLKETSKFQGTLAEKGCSWLQIPQSFFQHPKAAVFTAHCTEQEIVNLVALRSIYSYTCHLNAKPLKQCSRCRKNKSSLDSSCLRNPWMCLNSGLCRQN